MVLKTLFSEGGALARHLPGFTFRGEQLEMAEAVMAAMRDGRHLAIEAGTGIGKTFAYLVPALLWGQRVIISTGTRTLQDQLFGRDLALLGPALGRPVQVALLKGRSNYLCRHRLELARQSGTLDPALAARLDAIADWARSSRDGDLTTLQDLAPGEALQSWVSSTADNCLGARCPAYEQCFLVEARRRAQAADIVIVNHHLLLADLALKESGFGDLLPGADAIVVDEAHLLPEVAQQFFGAAISARELGSLARDVQVEAEALGMAADLVPALLPLERCVAEAAGLNAGANQRIPWQSCSATLREAFVTWEASLRQLEHVLGDARDASAGLARCWERCQDRLERLARCLSHADEPAGLRWVESASGRLSAHWAPLECGPLLAERIEAQGGCWIFTSATLAVGQDFTHFLGRIGLSEAETRVLASPFDYSRNARVYLPQGLPSPEQDESLDALLPLTQTLIDVTEGGAFLLFTSHRALQRAARWLAMRALPGPLLVQGEAPRTELLEAFRASGKAVLLGTSSFWQGVDVRGPALRLVVIDRLPFASPSDPVVRARIESARREGRDPFASFQLPQAVLALKQGVGRLIRDFGDRGLVVLGDSRVSTRRYGTTFLAALPPMQQLTELDDALAFAASLAPASGLRRCAP